MRRVIISERSKERLTHIEAPGCIVNIRHNLTSMDGNKVTSITVTPDQQFDGDQEWNLPDFGYTNGINVRVVQCEKPVHEPAERTNRIIYGSMILDYEAGGKASRNREPIDSVAFFHSMQETHYEPSKNPSKATQRRFMALAANPAYDFEIRHLWGGGVKIVVGRK